MPLVLIDVSPTEKAIINTDHVIAVREADGRVAIQLTDGNMIEVKAAKVADLFDHLGDCVPIP